MDELVSMKVGTEHAEFGRFVCPITHELLVDPVVAADGYMYERKAIESWLAISSNSPATNKPLRMNCSVDIDWR
jgi:hypothetical protein